MSLRYQLDKETGRAKTAEDCVEALRIQLSSVKDANRDLEMAVSSERARLEAVTLEYMDHKKEAGDTITKLRNTADKEAVSWFYHEKLRTSLHDRVHELR